MYCKPTFIEKSSLKSICHKGKTAMHFYSSWVTYVSLTTISKKWKAGNYGKSPLHTHTLRMLLKKHNILKQKINCQTIQWKLYRMLKLKNKNSVICNFSYLVIVTALNFWFKKKLLNYFTAWHSKEPLQNVIYKVVRMNNAVQINMNKAFGFNFYCNMYYYS